ncbi:MAG: hypothetical protein ACRDRJ_02225 [Streptosporangiaceae bacterium]
MGHWDELVVDELAARFPHADRDRLAALAQAAGTEIETLAGQSFGPAKRNSVSVNTCGLPFVELPGLLIGSQECPSGMWPIPNPVDQRRATIVQVGPVPQSGSGPPVTHVMPVASALRAAGGLVHAAARAGVLSRAFMLAWLGQFPPAERTAFLQELTDPSYRVHVPVATGGGDGWWFQITRRLLWITPAADEQRLVEPLFPDAHRALRTLVAVEPLLIAGRVTSHPADWAMAVRIWPSAVRPAGRPWRYLASAIHEHGIPVLSLDPESTAEEVQCQILLLAHWHKYVGADVPEIADAIAAAYPQGVERIARATRAPDTRAAAALLFEGLLQPGFDPARGAEAARRYVNRKATIAILNHRKTTDGAVRPWEALGVSERRYYKLLNRFAPKTGTRYEVDADVLEKIRSHLISRDEVTETHAAAMELLQERGFGYAAARKWLQRHDHSEALTAWPRSKRPPALPGS